MVGLSVRARTRVQIRVIASMATAARISTVLSPQSAPPGWNMNSTPRKPMPVLVQRRQPTVSPSMGMASRVSISGAVAATA